MYGSIVVIKHSGDDGAAFVLEERVATIGRDKSTNIRIMRNQASSFHGKIFADEKNTMCIQNTSSKNSITLNDGRLQPGEVVELQDKDVFAIAGRQFRYEVPSQKPAQAALSDKENARGPEEPFRCSEQEVIQDHSEVIKCEVDHTSRRRRISIEPDVTNPRSPAARRQRNNSIPAAFSEQQYEAAPPRRRSAFQPVALPTPAEEAEQEAQQEQEEAASSSSSEEECLADEISQAGMPTSVYAWKVANSATEEPELLEVATPQRAIANLRSNLSTQSILKTREGSATPEAMEVDEEPALANSVFRTPSRASRMGRCATTDGRQRRARVSFAKTDHVLLTPVSSKSRLKQSLLYKTPTKLTSPQERSDMLYQLNRKLTSDYDDESEEDFLAAAGDAEEFEEAMVESSDEECADVTDAMLASIRNSLPQEDLVASPAALACTEELDDSTASATSVEETDSEFLLSRPASARRGRRSLPAGSQATAAGRSRRKSASATPGETPDMEQFRSGAEPAPGEESPSAAGITRTQAALKALASPIQRIASSSNIASSFIGVINSIVASPKPAPTSVTPEPLKVRTLTSPITPQPHSRRENVGTAMRFFTPSKQKDAKPSTPEEKRAAKKVLFALWQHLRNYSEDGVQACQPFKEHKNIFAREGAPSCTMIEVYSAIQDHRVSTVAEFRDELLGMLDRHAESHTQGTAAYTGRLLLLKAFNNKISDLAEEGSPLLDEESLSALLVPMEEDKLEATQEDIEPQEHEEELDQHMADVEDADEDMAEADVEADVEIETEAEVEAEVEAEAEAEAEETAEEEVVEEAEEAAETRRSARKSVMFDEQEEVCKVPKAAARRSRRATVTEEEGQDVPEAVAVAPRASRRSRSRSQAPVEAEAEEAEQESVGSKRRSRRSAAPAEPAQKKAARRSRKSRAEPEPEPEPEAEAEAEAMEVEEAEEAAPAVDYNSWTCVVLKKELKKRNLPFNGRKADLVARLEESDRASSSEETPEAEANEAEAEAVVEEEEKVVEAPKPSRRSRKSRATPEPEAEPEVEPEVEPKAEPEAEPEAEPMEVEEAEEEAVEEAVPAVDYNSWTCVVLKKELKKRSLPFNGRKADLVARLEESDKAGGQVAEEAVEEAEPAPAPATRRTRRRR